jgi:hypothetical protein
MYPPSAVLQSCGVTAQAACEASGLDDVDSVPIRLAPRWMSRLWRGSVAAMTLPWAIYVDADHLRSTDSGPLILHELVHVRQWKRLGMWRFLRIYVSDYVRNRREGMDHHHAYLGIRLEKEARVAVARHLASGA